MVIDTSAIVVIALNEPDAPEIELRIADDPVRLISAATVLEAAMVLETRLGDRPDASLTFGYSRSRPRWFLSTPNRPMQRGAPGAATARGVTPLG